MSGEHRSWQDDEDEDDAMRAARGIVFGLALTALIVAVVFVLLTLF